MISKKIVAKAVSLMWLSSLIGAFFAFMTQVLIARHLEPSELGVFSSYYYIISLLVPLVGFGVAQFWIKEFGKYGWAASGVVASSLRVMILNFLFVAVLLVIFSVVFIVDGNERLVLLTLLFFLIGQVLIELNVGKSQLEERYIKISFWQLFPHATRFVALLVLSVVTIFQFNIFLVALVYGGVGVLILLFSLKSISCLLNKNYILAGHDDSYQGNKYYSVSHVYKGAFPFCLATIFHLIYFQSDIIILRYLGDDESAGYYNVSFVIMVAVLMLPSIIYQKFFLPKMHRWAYSNMDFLHSVYKKGNFFMALIGGCSLITVWNLAPVLIEVLFGENYLPSVELLEILALSIPFLFVSSSAGAMLVTKNFMTLKVKLMGGVAIFNLVLNILFVPNYGAVGAAYSTVSSNILLLLLYLYCTENYYFKSEKY